MLCKNISQESDLKYENDHSVLAGGGRLMLIHKVQRNNIYQLRPGLLCNREPLLAFLHLKQRKPRGISAAPIGL